MTESPAPHTPTPDPCPADECAATAPELRRSVGTVLRTPGRVIGRTLVRAWDDSIFAKAAQTAFWQTLSLPPLLLGLLGSLGFVGGWFGPNTVDIVQSKIISASRRVFSPNVVDQIISPTIGDMLVRGRGEIVSFGFLLSFWAGSSAISCFVDSICEAHGQHTHRNPVWQRIFALILYVFFLVLGVFTLPLVALGPSLIGRILPESWHTLGAELVDSFYYPAVGVLLLIGLTTLYRLALPKPLPWHRLIGGALVAGVFFLAASTILRFYLGWVTSTGYTYGALATPIAFLLFTFFLGFAVVLGAEFNATVQEFWPARTTRIEQMREWLAAQSAAGRYVPGPPHDNGTTDNGTTDNGATENGATGKGITCTGTTADGCSHDVDCSTDGAAPPTAQSPPGRSPS